MISTVLAAIDGSNHSLKAADTAAEIAAALKARLVLLNVVKAEVLPDSLRAYAEMEHLPMVNIDILKKVASELVGSVEKKARGKGVGDIVCEVQEGPIARTIVACAKHHKVDMIVIGSRGLGNIEATLRGGVSMRVGLLADCAVLTVK